MQLEGKNAVVTGGSRGIGRAIALQLAAHGANVVVAARDGSRCVEVAGEIAAHRVRGIGVACDVTEDADVRRLFDTADKELGGADVFVHAAGFAGGVPAQDVTRDEIQAMMDVHVQAAIAGAQLAAVQMDARGGGAIVLVSSVFGLGATSQTLAYGMAKAALAHAVKVLAVEWAARGIRVNGLAPGFVDTDMTAGLPERARDALLRRIPMRRAAKPEEIARCALFLASDMASFVDGHILVADGGERAR